MLPLLSDGSNRGCPPLPFQLLPTILEPNLDSATRQAQLDGQLGAQLTVGEVDAAGEEGV